MTYYQQLVDLSIQINDQARAGATLDRMASLYRRTEQYAAALDRYQQALTIWRNLQDTRRAEMATANIERLTKQLQDEALAGRTENGLVTPEEGSTVSGQIEILGLANDPAFEKWQLDLLLNQAENDATFIALARRPAPAVRRLTTLDTTKYPNGTHQLRLRIVRTDFNYDEYFVTFTIAN